MRQEKKQLRRKILEMRDRFTVAEIREKSLAITENFAAMEVYRKAETIMFFVPFRNEVDTRYLAERSMERHKKVLVPHTVKDKRELIPSRLLDWDDDLAPGEYGIYEPPPEKLRPVNPRLIDLVIVPGVAFDLSGNRLGYGGGYYDRFFALLRDDTSLVAMVFDQQIVERVPVEPWDRRVDSIVTEKRVLSF
ncbi:MAG: 5-formyltetrahydrofolate cyclo-ligase [Dethiobacteria bacterium]